MRVSSMNQAPSGATEILPRARVARPGLQSAAPNGASHYSGYMANMRRVCFTLCLMLISGVTPLSAQSPPEKNDAFWNARARQEAASAAQLVLASDPLAVVILRHQG